MHYIKGNPNEYVAVTGRNIKNVKIIKSGMIWPFQNGLKFSIQPRDYSMNLRAMTKEKLQFELPVVFTVGPDVNQRGENSSEATDAVDLADAPEDRGDALMKYSMLLADTSGNDHQGLDHIGNIVKGIIEGETRVLVSSMTMEEIFTEREQFKKRIYHNIQSELEQFGLKIYNANVKELTDAPNSTYFASLSRKAHEGATNQARVDVAEAQWHGNVGEAERQGRQNREIAKIHAETAVQKTERDTEKSQAEATLAQRKAAFDRDVNIAKIEATRATEARDEELRKAVEVKRAQTEIERLRAVDVVKATITREAKQQAADAKAYEMQAASNAELYREQKAAEAHAYKTRVEAEAAYLAATKDAEAQAFKTKMQAEASFLAASKDASATLIRQAKEAEGLTAMAAAYTQLATAFGGPHGLLQYLMVEKGLYVELARANAQAVQGMAPKMTIWNTGSSGSATADQDPAAAIRNTYQMLPPLMSTINEQTGITLPEWQFGRMAVGEAVEGKGKVKVNGVVNGVS